MSRIMLVDEEESILRPLFRLLRARLERLEPGITEVRCAAGGSAIVASASQAGE